MISMTLAQIAEAVAGVVVGPPDLVVSGEPFLDSREPVPEGLFVAVAGEHVDGHDYAAAAVDRGAAAVLASRDVGVPAVLVDDVVAALGRLARAVLDRLPDLTVLALTGSQGKTGTKDFLGHVLAAAGPTVATRGNLNNELGVPLTALRCTGDTRFLVVEMGARGVGHIGYLCSIAPPRVAAVLNVGTAHLGEFGSVEGIARAKGEIVESLPADGVAVLNADDPRTAAMASRTAARVLTFGSAGEVAWRDVTADDLGRPAYSLGFAGEWLPVRLSQVGSHQVANATAAAAMALAAGVPLGLVAEALNRPAPGSRWRMELHQRDDGLVVVNDAYNANPASMRAALDALRDLGRRRGRTFAVLGEMRELGPGAGALHRDVGGYAAACEVDVVVAVGPEAAAIAAGARHAPGWAGLAVDTAGRDAALAWVRNNVTAGDVVLVKASRGAALEVLAEGLLAPTGAAPTASDQGDPGA
ncbi:UDP-N-acetylmuramoyl-tripeptide--D-alanyl-D-alanine ligase [Nocardioides sp.]|uniref:UDP-N-acetylmuramoyl-tripeptide--D-alanyl-D- alanine ligase n=1 Tax=Nocardioides sp. TaxID=35761 RepID=UPI0035296DD8